MNIADTDQSSVVRNLIYALLALLLVFGTVGYRLLGGSQYSPARLHC